MKYTFQSTAMYSSWILQESLGILFDAGEGVAMELQGGAQGLRKIFLTHAHMDHLSGLWGLARIWLRQKNAAPIPVYFPRSRTRDGFPRRMKCLVDFLHHDGTANAFSFIPITDKDSIGVKTANNPRAFEIRPFRTNHGRVDSLGYTLFENRTRLKPEYQNLPGHELGKMRRETEAAGGKFNPSDTYQHPLMTYTGDTSPISPALLGGPDILFHDATFMRVDDEDEHDHSTLAEAAAAAHHSGARSLVAFHISPRYLRERETVNRAIAQAKIDFPGLNVFAAWPRQVMSVEVQAGKILLPSAKKVSSRALVESE